MKNVAVAGTILLVLVVASYALVILDFHPDTTGIANAGDSKSTTIKTAHVLHTTGADFILDSRWAAAMTACKEGIVMIGDSYVKSEIIDDTSQKLTISLYHRAQGNIEGAAKVYCSTLEVRLSLLRAELNNNKV